MDRRGRTPWRPQNPLTKETIWEWAEVLALLLFSILEALEVYLRKKNEVLEPRRVAEGFVTVPSSSGDTGNYVQVLREVPLPDGGTGKAAGRAGVPPPADGKGPAKNKKEKLVVPQSEIPNDKALAKWGRKTVDFGKSEAKGMTYSEARELQPQHAKWVLANVRPDNKKNYGEEALDYANYLRCMEAREKQKWGDPESISDLEEMADD